MLLEEAKRWLWLKLRKGEHCPCCGQFAKIYKIKFNSAMAWSLIQLYQMNEAEWVDMTKLLTKMATVHKRPHPQGNASKAGLWGLIAPLKGTRKDGSKHNGFWRITELGKRFARGETTIPRHVFHYDGEVLGFSNELITIAEAIDDHFNYNELMGS